MTRNLCKRLEPYKDKKHKYFWPYLWLLTVLFQLCGYCMWSELACLTLPANKGTMGTWKEIDKIAVIILKQSSLYQMSIAKQKKASHSCTVLSQLSSLIILLYQHIILYRRPQILLPCKYLERACMNAASVLSIWWSIR